MIYTHTLHCLIALWSHVAAESLGLPLVPPFLQAQARHGTGSFRRGANFAVGGATALDASFFHRWDPPGGSVFPLNASLGVQLQWFQSLKRSLCATPKGMCVALHDPRGHDHDDTDEHELTRVHLL
jgi:hypothetical protein